MSKAGLVVIQELHSHSRVQVVPRVTPMVLMIEKEAILVTGVRNPKDAEIHFYTDYCWIHTRLWSYDLRGGSPDKC